MKKEIEHQLKRDGFYPLKSTIQPWDIVAVDVVIIPETNGYSILMNLFSRSVVLSAL